MKAIWRTSEHFPLEPALGVSTWCLNHAGPHMRILMDKEGPFKKCAYDRHKTPQSERATLLHVIPEAGIFDWRACWSFQRWHASGSTVGVSCPAIQGGTVRRHRCCV